MLGKEHGIALVVAGPTGVAESAVGQVRRKQSVKVVVGKSALQGFEADSLKNDVAVGIGEDFLVDAIASAVARVGQFEDGYAGLAGTAFEGAVALLFGKEITAVGDNESHVAGAGLVDPGKINFVENAMAQREPDFAVLVEGCAGTHFGARGPTRRNARPSRSIACGRIIHGDLVL